MWTAIPVIVLLNFPERSRGHSNNIRSVFRRVPRSEQLNNSGLSARIPAMYLYSNLKFSAKISKCISESLANTNLCPFVLIWKLQSTEHLSCVCVCSFLVNEYMLEIFFFFLLHNKSNIKWICCSASSLFKTPCPTCSCYSLRGILPGQ